MTKTVVITGASAGVGRALALLFARKKFSIGLISRNRERLSSLKKEIEALGNRAEIAIADVADAEQIERGASELENSLGPIDIWINNAMASVFSPFQEMTDQEFKRVTEVTYLGYVYGTRTALKRMIPRNQGTIVQVGSALTYMGIPLQSAYCGAKHAVRGFTDSLRCELIQQTSKVKITIVQLPGVNTPQFNWVKSRLPRKARPVPPVYQPEVAAEAIYWASLHYRREWHLGFKTVGAILANKLFPTFWNHYLAKNAYDAQQYNGLEDTDRPHNLFETVSGDFGAHGDFDAESLVHSKQFWLSKHRKFLSFAAVGAFVIILAIWVML
jgi:short-subunit dehydrogenase